MATRLHRAASSIHKWLALIIGVQVLLWVVSGSVMSILPINTVRGEHLATREAPVLGDLSGLVSPAVIASQVAEPVASLRYRNILGQPVVEVEDTKDNVHLFVARTGAPRPAFSATEARRIAEAAWIEGKAQIKTVERIETESPEYRGRLPAWRVTMADDVRIFVPLATGEVAAVRSSTWRFYDFFWSLHIMDWKNHENFNSWWLIAFALGGVAFACSGIIILAHRWPLRKRKRA